MNLEEAIKFMNSRPITAWMAYGIIKWNEGYVIITGEQMVRHPKMEILKLRKGEAYPKSPVGIKKI